MNAAIGLSWGIGHARAVPAHVCQIQSNITMKQILSIIATLSLAMGTSYAGCGKTTTDAGKLKSFDKDTKSLAIEVDGKTVTRTLTPSAKGAADVEKLVGKQVSVVSSHGKVESVTKG
jgi:hypothetical protein